MKRKLFLLASAVVLLTLVTSVSFALGQGFEKAHNKINQGVGDSTSIEAPNPDEIYNLVNLERTKKGLSALVRNPLLDKTALEKCQDMASRDYWSHNTPDGAKPWVLITKDGVLYRKAGENLAYGFRDATDTVTGWMNSPSHRDNILLKSYTDVGYAVCESINYQKSGFQFIIVQHFIQKY